MPESQATQDAFAAYWAAGEQGAPLPQRQALYNRWRDSLSGDLLAPWAPEDSTPRVRLLQEIGKAAEEVWRLHASGADADAMAAAMARLGVALGRQRA